MRKALLLMAVAAMFAVAACGGSSSSLTGHTWQWTASTEKVPASQSVVPDPQNYTIEFKSDGTYAMKADCNSITGAYTTSGNSLTIQPGAGTLVACAPESMDQLFTTQIFTTVSYAIADSQLVLTQANEGTMTFK